MSSDTRNSLSRRTFLGTAAVGLAGLAAPALAQTEASTVEIENDLNSNIRRNISSFRSLQ